MLGFYQNDRADGCLIDQDGDMLLYQWGTYDWGKGESFELDITRQFIENASEDENIKQLSLTFRFHPTEGFRQIGEGNLWCSSPEGIEVFRAFIFDSPAFSAISSAESWKVALEFGMAG